MERLAEKQARINDFLRASQFYDRPTAITVRQVMTPNPVCVRPDVTVLSLVEMFHAKGFRHLLVADGGRHLLGVVSDRDVARCFGPSGRPEKKVLTSITAADIMSSDLISISPDRPITQAISLMVEEGVNCLPVISEGCLLGIITSTDFYAVLRALLETMPGLQSGESLLSDSNLSA
jgi:CBS domain-containing protein